MVLGQSNFHKDFQLNEHSFSSVYELLDFSKSISNFTYQFLKEWFSDDEFVIVQTSGSTGKPKQIQLKKEFMINSALETGHYFNLPEKTTVLLCLSTEYIAGKMMLVRAITLGWDLYIVQPNSHPLKNTKKTYDFSAMVPLQLENSLPQLHQIKKLIVGGGVVSNQLQNKLQKVSTEVFATYGMTETSTHIAVKKLNNIKVNPNFYKTLPNITIYKDVRNCLVIKAPKVSDEVIFTNDVVQLISDIQFEWLGRFDTIINSGGVKLHPEKIEEKLSKIIKERFFVTGISDAKLGEKLILIVEFSVISSENEKSQKLKLQSEIKKLSSLSKFETPKEIYFVSKFIETTTKKIQRKKTLDLIKF